MNLTFACSILDRRCRDKEERGWKDDVQRRESLTDVVKGCVLRVVENKRGGGVEKERERDRLLTSALQYTSVLPEREHTMTD